MSLQEAANRAIDREARPETEREHPLSDLGNARLFIVEHGQDLAYVKEWGAWLVFNGKHWATDPTGEVIRRAEQTIIHSFRSAQTERAALEKKLADASSTNGDGKKLESQIAALETAIKHYIGSHSRRSLEAMVSLASTEEEVARRPEDFDRNPMLLNVRNGTVDLQTGELRAHQRADRITKMVPVAFDPQAEAPRWRRFLGEITGGDENLQRFLQKAAGYSLTGETREECLFLCWGTGANGKSTFLETVRACLGDYAAQTDTSTFLDSKSDRVPNDLARLRAARFVSAVETGDGRRLAETLVKQITGRDTVTARFLFHEFFEFKPQFKIWIATNHKPVIHDSGYAMWRRIRLLPFSITIPKERQDPTLRDQLLEELPGVFRWLVEGSLDWQLKGLGAAEAVTHATSNYQREQDPLVDFIAEMCILSPDAKVGASDLYSAYAAWCGEGNGEPMTQNSFGRRLSDKGLQRARVTKRRIWVGIGLKIEPGLE